MKKKIILIISFAVFVFNFVSGQQNGKIPLDHSVYDSWKDIRNTIISNDGKWISYEINPQKGDGWLYLMNLETNRLDSVSRGYTARFSPNTNFLAFKIKPPFSVTRQAKKEKMKKEKMPKDSLGIWILTDLSLLKFERVKSYKIPEENTSWIVYHLEKELIKKDTVGKEEKKQEKIKPEEENEKNDKKNGKPEGTVLVIYNPITLSEHQFKDVTEYHVSKDGSLIGFIEVKTDSVDHSKAYAFDTSEEDFKEIWLKDGLTKKIISNETGDQVTFIHTEDTAKTKVYSLYLWDSKFDQAKTIVDTLTPGIPENWSVSEHGNISFSENGTKLYFGTAPKPEQEPEDTLLDNEKYEVDVWNWQDPLLQPMQKVQLDREKKRSYLAVYHTKLRKMVQLGDEEVRDVNTILKGNGDIAIGRSGLPYLKLISWESNRYEDIYTIDVNTGKKKLLLKKSPSYKNISQYGKYLIWYDTKDSSWYARSIISGNVASLTREIPVNFFNELHDSPSDPRPYGLAGWIGEDENVLINDRFDIWKIDPSGKRPPVNLTNGYGRKNNIRFRYIKLDREAETIDPKEKILLSSFHIYNKKSGFASIHSKSANDPFILLFDDFRFYNPVKSKHADKLIWRRSSFVEYPDLWISDIEFRNIKKVSNTNLQQGKYLWGTSELVEWISFDQKKLQGILYRPENFNPGKKYPMIVYFYERSSDGIHRHSTPRPSSSSMNITFYISNGYLVFVPDISYIVGYPGESAYNAVVSGTMAMINRFDFIDNDHIGLNGHSWGGYQIAYLVTRTNMYRCAHSGAPVSNMTSAYGGIRWGSGMSRMFQYEQSQSRIGGTLWEKPVHYFQNSPIFFVPKIETPVLMMHNDKDGAVPWYQGIEFFVALRRLNKPVWMLNYNGEKHGLGKRANQKDFTIRVFQYYNHFLKEAPAPEWMINGIPALKKGKNDGYKLMEEEVE
ncbi:MAG: S9 family peptidase [Bacteroidales bacterium]|nr:S9 family peptidase [Bacteroidales bacterium]